MVYWDTIDFPDGVEPSDGWNEGTCVNNKCTFTFETPDDLFRKAGDEYPLIVMFTNEEKRVDVKVSKAIITNTNEEFFSVRSDFDNEWTMSLKNSESGWDEIYQNIYISMTKTPITEEESTATITVEFTLTPVRID